MKTYISTLRGINVGGRNRVSMNDLKELYTSIGLDPRTYVQSGNVVFKSEIAVNSRLENIISKKIKQSLKMDVAVIIRSNGEMNDVVKNTPFSKKDPMKLHVTFLSEKPDKVPIGDIQKAKAKNEEFSFAEKEIYLFCPNGYGMTKLSNNFFEKRLGVRTTTRNWNTVNALLSMSQE
ncbi:MAG: DUF1697 domain-containing protein [Thaumarchaeota archaeon]|nr:DUF1697 domain-containing protein [Nitrososphaerota archaeon]MDG6922365.1 DUF1697 domain-containing protein [Nitrososphaerota archaeon]